MPSFARELETTLHNALGEASKRRHEYATLEHLLMALVDDTHASQVMTACGVNRTTHGNVKRISTGPLIALFADTRPTDTDRVSSASSTSSSRQSWGVATHRQRAARCSPLASYAVYFLHQQDMRRPTRDVHLPRRRQGDSPADVPRRAGRGREKTGPSGDTKYSALQQFPSTSRRRQMGKVRR